MSRRVPSGSFTVPAMPDTILRDLPLPTYRQVNNHEAPSNERAIDSSAEQFLDQRSNSQYSQQQMMSASKFVIPSQNSLLKLPKFQGVIPNTAAASASCGTKRGDITTDIE